MNREQQGTAARKTDLIVRANNSDAAPASAGDAVYADLLNRVFRSGPRGHSAVAFTSCTPGAGVGAVVSSLARTLALRTENPVLGTRVGALRYINGHSMAAVPGSSNLWTLKRTEADDGAHRNASGWESFDGFRKASLVALRQTFQYVLFDCEPLTTSDDISLVAGLCDGVILVVEADRTRPAQIERARTVIAAAGGNLIGCVLNKRKYPIPKWLYRWLSPASS
jgi:Mrp family chromosome partitioning ATPase